MKVIQYGIFIGGAVRKLFHQHLFRLRPADPARGSTVKNLLRDACFAKTRSAVEIDAHSQLFCRLKFFQGLFCKPDLLVQDAPPGMLKRRNVSFAACGGYGHEYLKKRLAALKVLLQKERGWPPCVFIRSGRSIIARKGKCRHFRMTWKYVLLAGSRNRPWPERLRGLKNFSQKEKRRLTAEGEYGSMNLRLV